MSYTFHQSWLQTFSHCPEQARVDMFDPQPRVETDSTALGTAAHAAFDYTLDCIINGEPYGSEAYDLIDNELALLQPWKRTKYSDKQVRKLAHQAYTLWHADVLPEVQPLHTEHKFSVPHGNVLLEGTIDCVDERGFLWDWKTASRWYEPWEYERWAVQPTVYCYAMDMTDFTFAVMVHSGAVQLLPVTRDDRHFVWLGKQIDRIVDLIEADLPHWPLNDAGWWCSPKWCDNFTNCKGAVMGDDWP